MPHAFASYNWLEPGSLLELGGLPPSELVVLAARQTCAALSLAVQLRAVALQAPAMQRVLSLDFGMVPSPHPCLLGTLAPWESVCAGQSITVLGARNCFLSRPVLCLPVPVPFHGVCTRHGWSAHQLRLQGRSCPPWAPTVIPMISGLVLPSKCLWAFILSPAILSLPHLLFQHPHHPKSRWGGKMPQGLCDASRREASCCLAFCPARWLWGHI